MTDHSRVSVLEALQAFRERGDIGYGPPGHKQGRGADPRVVQVVGEGVFASDVLTLNGLDDRRESQGVVEQAEDLMADAVDADVAFFSTCGSSLSVKTAIMSVAGPGEKLLVSRNAHKSVIAGVIIAGIEPVWVHPHFDDDLKLAHPPEPDDVRRAESIALVSSLRGWRPAILLGTHIEPVPDAIAHLEQNTGIRFVQRTATNQASLPNWIQIRSNGAATASSPRRRG